MVGCWVLCMVADHMFSQGVTGCTDLGTDFAYNTRVIFNMICFYVPGYVLLCLAYMATFYATIFILTYGQNLGLNHHIEGLVA